MPRTAFTRTAAYPDRDGDLPSDVHQLIVAVARERARNQIIR